MKLKFIILIFILIQANNVLGQNFNIERGMPFIKSYTPDDYSAHEQNFDLIQAPDGTMYFANFSGILSFNGSVWTLIHTSTGLRTVSLALNYKGTVYVGGLNDFGYLKTLENNTEIFVSLVDTLSENRNFGAINNVHCINEKTYFVSDTIIYIADKNDSITKIKTKNIITSSFNIKNELYFFFKTDLKTNVTQNGLTKLKDNKFIQISNEENYWIDDIVTMFEHKKTNTIILGSSKQGFFSLNNNKILKLSGSVHKYVIDKGMTCGQAINGSKFAFGTLTGGVVLSDNDGNITQIIDKKSNLTDDAVNKLFMDRNHELWAATDYGISVIKTNWPITFIKSNSGGLIGKVQKMKIINNNIYVATDKGLNILDDSIFIKVNKINYACWDIEKIENTIIVSSTKGIYTINNNVAELLPDNEFTYSLQISKKNKEILYAGQIDKIQAYTFENKTLKPKFKIEGFNGYPTKIEETETGDLYIEVPPAKMYIYKIKTNELININSKNEYFFLHLNKIDGKIFFTSEKGLVYYNENTKNIENYNFYKQQKNTKEFWAYDFLQLPDGNIIFTDGEQKNTAVFIKNKDSYTLNQNILTPINNISINNFIYDTKYKNIWMGGKSGIVIFQLGDSLNTKNLSKTYINQIIKLSSDSAIKINNYKDNLLKLQYKDNSLRINFSAPEFPATGKIEYRYMLIGFDNDTSEWNSLNYKDYTNLPDDNYVFYVEAKNEFNQTLQSTSFKFKIITPVYRRWWAIVIYILLIIAAGKIILDKRMKNAEKEKNVLEALIKERTEEIAKSKEEIELQRDYLFKQKQEIIDSINYAKKIQEAVLPAEEYANEILNEHFILFRPRDIVSGDFYWIKKINNFVIIVAADCTGHGVPGAFMSMLGSSYLNEIVTRRSLDSAGQILNRLRQKVKKSLHQKGAEGEQKDGMDIALIVIDQETMELQYSGAYNPLYLIRKQDADNYELIEKKADRQPIGIHINEKEFSNHKVELLKGDSLYIFSDGYIDQFGGDAGGKFKTARFKELLLSIQERSMKEQHDVLERSFIKWKRDLNQIDDVLVIGVKI